MIAGIFMLAAMVVVAAIATLVGSIMLVPTDLGFAYLQASSILIGAGAIVMAIGFAARALDRRLAQLAPVERKRAKPAEPAEPLPEQIPAEPTPAEPTPADEAPAVSVTAGAAGAAIAAAGATLAATSLLRDREESAASEVEPIASIAADLPANDPFHDILRTAADTDLQSEPAGDTPVPAIETPAPAVTEPDQPKADLPTIDLPPVELPAPVDIDAIRAAVDDAVSEAVAQVEDEEKPESSEDKRAGEGASPPSKTTSGLIEDDDLTAIATAHEAPLAPLSTLTAVGSYDSGGTRFTMYSDGSVVAQGTEGERRFRSLEELRRHIGRD